MVSALHFFLSSNKTETRIWKAKVSLVWFPHNRIIFLFSNFVSKKQDIQFTQCTCWKATQNCKASKEY